MNCPHSTGCDPKAGECHAACMRNTSEGRTGAKHTPGRLVHDTSGGPNVDIRAESGRKVAVTWGLGSPKNKDAYERRTEEDRANARRLVACWNALLDAPTELLEQAVAAGITDVSMGNLFSARLKLQKQCDDLLAALRGIAAYHGEGPPTTPWRDIVRDVGEAARAAIAKATGGQS